MSLPALPANLKFLKSLFARLFVCCTPFWVRSLPIRFELIKAECTRACQRQVTERHLRQLVTICGNRRLLVLEKSTEVDEDNNDGRFSYEMSSPSVVNTAPPLYHIVFPNRSRRPGKHFKLSSISLFVSLALSLYGVAKNMLYLNARLANFRSKKTYSKGRTLFSFNVFLHYIYIYITCLLMIIECLFI